ncbi:MAG TPA: hypothetical protein VFE10_01330 [Phenylobacterium sp.]|jgi:hypothetical protein|nr:hypothetical protein [Phenylobacterium sp.]
MEARELVDVAIDEDRWAPTELWLPAAVGRRPILIGAVVGRNKTVRAGGPPTDITTLRP